MTASGWAQDDSSVEERYSTVQAAFLQEDFGRVITLVESFPVGEDTRQVVPLQIRMGLWYALSLDRSQRAGEALRELDRLKTHLVTHPDLADHHRLVAETLFWEGEIGRRAHELVRARHAYQQLLTRFPRAIWRAQAQLGLGLVLFQQQAYEAAGEQVREVARGSIESPVVREAMFLEGLAHLKRGQAEDAQQLFRELLTQPLNAELRQHVTLSLAEALAALAHLEEAIVTYQRVIAEGSDSSWARVARFGIGWIYFQQHRCSESLEAFKDYVNSLPPAIRQRADRPWRGRTESVETVSSMSGGSVEETLVQLWAAQGRCLMELGDAEAAIAHFETLERLVPDHPRAIEAALSHSELLERQQRLDEARAVIAPWTGPSVPLSHRHHAQARLGSLELLAGEADSAQARFLSVTDAQEAELRQAAFNGLGDAALFLGHDEDAHEWYDRAVALDPTSVAGQYAAYQQGRLLLKAARRQEGIEHFRALIARTERWPNPLIRLNARLAMALAHIMDDHPDRAREELHRAVQEAPESRQAARVNYYLALVALREGDHDQAKQLCQQVVRQAPESDEAFDAQLLLIDFIASEESLGAALERLQTFVETFEQLPVRRRGIIAQKIGHFARPIGAYATAIRWYETAWRLVPSQQGELDYRIASCYEEGGDWILASNRYRAIRQPPWTIRGHLAAAKLLERAAQWQEAARLYQSIVQQAVPEAKIAQERLAALSTLEAESQPQ